MASDKAPVTKAQQTRDKQAAKKKAEDLQIRRARHQRKTWEASDVGQARTKDIVDLATEHHNKMVADNPRLFPNGPSKRLNLTHAQIYRALNMENNGHGYGDQQLPGFENPHAAPEPPRWEDLSREDQRAGERKLRMQGTNLKQMQSDFGAQLDQGVWRAHMAGHHETYTAQSPTGKGKAVDEARQRPVGFTEHFYGEHPENAPEPMDRPKEMMRESRRHIAAQRGAAPGQISADSSVDPMLHTAAVGHVSPNVKFAMGARGKRTSPNIEAAESIFHQSDAGIPPEDMTSGTNRKGKTNQSRPANAVRAGMMIAHVSGGGTVGTSRNAPSQSSPQGSNQWGPKTGPFTNSFDAQHPDFLVPDVHTGGGGMLPHLGTNKPLRRNADGSLARKKEFREDPRSDKELLAAHKPRDVFYPGKSGREEGIEKGGVGASVPFHTMADYAARQATQERGLGSSVRRPQATQWGEEQIQRKEADNTLDLPSHATAYPPQGHLVNPNQMRLF